LGRARLNPGCRHTRFRHQSKRIRTLRTREASNRLGTRPPYVINV
jgi:hypothetical protein